MSCEIYALNMTINRRYAVGTLPHHTRMAKWLKNNGRMELVYEIWKQTGIHSRWCWKPDKEKWSRMATPKRN